MSSTSGDAEIRAIEQVIQALDPLESDARDRVLDYAFKRLGIAEPNPSPAPTRALAEEPSPPSEEVAPSARVADIRALREEKQPKSANEMAAVVGYYLAEVAPSGERKTEIGTPDIEKYFKQAQQRLPEAPGKTLQNAAAAGYFDSAGRGLYSLNPVGHNLVAHGLPREASAPQPRKRRSTSKSKAKKSQSKKAKAPGRSKGKRKAKS
jgi:hypothetical protein